MSLQLPIHKQRSVFLPTSWLCECLQCSLASACPHLGRLGPEKPGLSPPQHLSVCTYIIRPAPAEPHPVPMLEEQGQFVPSPTLKGLESVEWLVEVFCHGFS